MGISYHEGYLLAVTTIALCEILKHGRNMEQNPSHVPNTFVNFVMG